MTYVIVLVVAAIALFGVVLYNSLVKSRQMAEEAWSGIDVQLKRRADLIPNLIETVKGYAAHEKTTLEGVIELRQGAGAFVSAKAADQESAARLQAAQALVAQGIERLRARGIADDEIRRLVEAELAGARRGSKGGPTS